jgi:hypothetical protein
MSLFCLRNKHGEHSALAVSLAIVAIADTICCRIQIPSVYIHKYEIRHFCAAFLSSASMRS